MVQFSYAVDVRYRNVQVVKFSVGGRYMYVEVFSVDGSND